MHPFRPLIVVNRVAILIITVLSALSFMQARQRPEFIPREDHELVRMEQQRYESSRNHFTKSSASNWLDVIYDRLNLRITTSPFYLYGDVTIRGKCRQDNPQFLQLDFTNSMHVDSLFINGVQKNITLLPSSFIVELDSGYHAGDIISTEVFYNGAPVPTGFGSFVSTEHNGTPWVWSLSEPYGAQDWWPCKNHPSDKADSVDIIITCDSSFSVGSNGRLASVTLNPDGTKTTHWEERYPIASYLVSVTLTNFKQFSNWFRYSPTDSLEVLNYVLPESLASAQLNLPRAVKGLEVYSKLFGLYPFVKEKYGHSEFGSGGMEHQTMTSIGTFDEQTVVHELAHQWFGDMITCGSWSDIWLNEGFASYCQALYTENVYGVGGYRDLMRFFIDRAKTAGGPVFAADTSNVRLLFNNARRYAKGACVLHMLRHLLGDTLFFRSMYAYATSPSLQYRTARTDDFRNVCEQTSGRNLKFFFDEWIYGEKFPAYVYSWTSKDSWGISLVHLHIRQTSGTPPPLVFVMPVDIRLTGGGWDTTVTVFDSLADQTFTLPMDRSVTAVQLDPDEWILKTVQQVPAIPSPSEFFLAQNFPNPFNSSTVIQYTLPHRSAVSIEVFNTLGERVTKLVGTTQPKGTYVANWDAGDVPGGVYFYRLVAVDASNPQPAITLVRKMVVVK